MPTFTYEQAILLSRITLNPIFPDALCLDYACSGCPAYSGIIDDDECQFIIPYNSSYDTDSHHVRADMLAQVPPEQYPELYI